MKLYKVHTLYSLFCKWLPSGGGQHCHAGKSLWQVWGIGFVDDYFANLYFEVSELAWNGVEPLKYQKNMARATSKFILGERGRLVWVMIDHVMEKVNCKHWPIIRITNGFAVAGSVQRGEGGEHPQRGCVPDFPGPPQGEWAGEGGDVFLFQLFPFQLFINHLLQDQVLLLGKDHGKIRGRPYFGSRRGRSFAA